MCVILVSTTAKEILEIDLDAAWRTNPDGAGVAYRGVDKKAKCIKGIMKLRELYKTLRNLPEHIQIVVHLRIATHGAVNKENTHPFQVDDDTLLFHNGTMSYLGEPGDKGFSDSEHLAYMLGCLDVQERTILMGLVMDRSGYNKFAIMNQHGTYTYGHFMEATKNKNVKASNLHWEYGSYRAGKGSVHRNWNDNWKDEYEYENGYYVKRHSDKTVKSTLNLPGVVKPRHEQTDLAPAAVTKKARVTIAEAFEHADLTALTEAEKKIVEAAIDGEEIAVGDITSSNGAGHVDR